MISTSVWAATPINCDIKENKVSLEEAKEYGVEILLDGEWKDSCRIINVLAPSSFRSMEFVGVSIYLYKESEFVGGFDLRAGLNDFGNYSSPFEVCPAIGLTKLRIVVGYGEYCKGETIVIEQSPKNLEQSQPGLRHKKRGAGQLFRCAPQLPLLAALGEQ